VLHEVTGIRVIFISITIPCSILRLFPCTEPQYVLCWYESQKDNM